MRQIVIFGLTITSSWGNGHATTYRGLLAGLHQRGWRVVFYEREAAWYAAHRDLRTCPYADIRLYPAWEAVRTSALAEAAASDAVVIGSYCAGGAQIAAELVARRGAAGPVLAFYDIDTPVTVEYLRGAGCDYLRADQISAFDLYLSFTAGPMLSHLEQHWGARRARVLHCCCDPAAYPPPAAGGARWRWDLGYMGTYAPDRQAALEEMLLVPARLLPHMRFAVAGSMYPVQCWPANVCRLEHIAPGGHAAFYRNCRLCLNLTRQAMVQWGYSPSIRLFEAAACGTPILSDRWPGAEEFFRPGEEMLIAESSDEVAEILTRFSPARLARIAAAAQRRLLAEHTGAHRAAQLEAYLAECCPSLAAPSPGEPAPPSRLRA